MFKVHVNEKNQVTLPEEVIKQFSDRSFEVVIEGNKMIFIPIEEKKYLWQTATPEELAQSFLEWARSHKDWADFPDQTWSREDIYDE